MMNRPGVETKVTHLLKEEKEETEEVKQKIVYQDMQKKRTEGEQKRNDRPLPHDLGEKGLAQNHARSQP